MEDCLRAVLSTLAPFGSLTKSARSNATSPGYPPARRCFRAQDSG
jgi:hypothetical protein